MNKSQIASWLTLIAATANTIYGFIEGNAGVLTDFGISPRWNQIIFLIGLIATSLSTSLAAKK